MLHSNPFDQLKETNSQVDIGWHQPAYATSTSEGTTDGLIGHWALDDGPGSSTAADSAGSHTGTLNGNSAWTSGRVGSDALIFDGNDNVATASTTWGFTTTGTMTAWVKTTSSGSTTVASLAHGTVADEMMLSVGYFVGGKAQIFAHSSVNNFTYRSSSTSVNDGHWHFVAGMLDGGVSTNNLRIFIDGVEETGTAGAYNSVQALSDSTARFFTIGDRSTTNAAYSTPFNGTIDDVRIYNRALSTNESRRWHPRPSSSCSTRTARAWLITSKTPMAMA